MTAGRPRHRGFHRAARAILYALVTLGGLAVLALMFGAAIAVHWLLHWVGGP